MSPSGDTLLELFLSLATSSDVIDNDVVSCAGETWTYGELNTISSGLASTLGQQYGQRPTVALISENHPYMLVLVLAVWKLGGIVAPLDHHAPRNLMEGMLRNITPTFVVIFSSDVHNLKVVQELNIPAEILRPGESTITDLTQNYLHFGVDVEPELYWPPNPEDISFYIHTSSASSASNLKCVPISHHSLITNGRSQLEWFCKTYPDVDFRHIRSLGWSPFSHLMSICLDFVMSVLFTAGCYIFAVVPTTYGDLAPEKQEDLSTVIMKAILTYEPNAFAGVPWIIGSFMAAWTNETDMEKKAEMMSVLKKFKYIISSGAATSEDIIQWALEHELNLLLSMGMTELGGLLFHSRITDFKAGWRIEDSCVNDATFTLVDNNGEIAETEGELYISSRRIAKNYLNYANGSFSEDSDGLITFRTGDIYESPKHSGRLIWKGRRDDFIQLKSGESLDPRILERALNACPVVTHSAVIGNNFLAEAADYICAIIELRQEALENSKASIGQVTKTLSIINRGLAPPLRIAWSRVLILEKGQSVPYNRKRTIFRKKLQDIFGEQLSRLLTSPGEPVTTKVVRPVTLPTPAPTIEEAKALVPSPTSSAPSISTEEARKVVFDTLCNTLGVSPGVLHANSQSTFAELGMDSAMAMTIVNVLNRTLSLALPPNTCHIHIDLDSLTTAVLESLKTTPTLSPAVNVLAPISRPLYNSQLNEPIAIVGQALRLPGNINTPESLWEALISKREDIMTKAPEDRWDHASFGSSGACQITFEKSGFIDIASFDNAFFGISPTEAIFVSPTVRLALQSVFEALENANIPISRVKGTDMGVFVAAGLDTGYNELLYHDKDYEGTYFYCCAFGRFYGTGIATSTACGRISYGGLVALDHAVRHLQSGRGESAIVCGVNTHTMPGLFGFLSAQKMTSTNSRCATFTSEADGYVPSEGVVSLILKTQSAAVRDGDTILGVIKATDTMHNGRTQGLVAPSVKGQAALHKSLLRLSSLTPGDIDFIETHGTGTPLGDLIEIQGINDVFHSSHTPSRPLIIGAAKSCIGHTETTSGLVGVVKVLSSFSNKAVPGLTHLNVANINPAIDCSLAPLRIPSRIVNLKVREHQPLRALAVAYGFTGTIAGAVLEAAPPDKITPAVVSDEPSGSMLFVVSAKTEAALLAYIESYIDFCRRSPESKFRSICYTSCIGREHYRFRFACAVIDMGHLISKLEDRLSDGLLAPKLRSNGLVFAFPGQGSQFEGMAQHLSQAYPAFHAILKRYADTASTLSGFPIISLLLGTGEAECDINQSRIAQICIFVYQCSVFTWLSTIGVQPQTVIGHSFGELAAAVCSSAMDYHNGLKFVIARAAALAPKPSNPGAMVAITAAEEIVRHYIRNLGIDEQVVIAVFNGEDNHVVSGSTASIKSLYATVKGDGIRSAILKVDQGFHSTCIEPALPGLLKWLDEEAVFQPLKIPFYSTVLVNKIPSQRFLDTEYWIEHARKPVQFYKTTKKLDEDESLGIIIDVGPQPTMYTSMQDHDLNDKVLIATTLKRGQDQAHALLEALARLFENNVDIDFVKLYADHGESLQKTSLPIYPFQLQCYYPSFRPSRNVPQSKSTTEAEFEILYVDQALIDIIHDHRIERRKVLPGIAFADLLAQLPTNSSKYVDSVRFHQPWVLEVVGSTLVTKLKKDGTFTVSQGGLTSGADRLCSGSLVPPKTPYQSKPVSSERPIKVLSSDQVYASFDGSVHFGPAFRNVKQVSVWDDHIDALISVPSSSYSRIDRVRKLDPCLHMFGALFFEDQPESIRRDGFYLPTALEGFQLHSDDLPEQFICRYHLPFKFEHNYRSVCITFEVLSLAGQLLASCQNYKVAWILKGTAVRAAGLNSRHSQWIRNTWREEKLFTSSQSAEKDLQSQSLVYLGTTTDSNLFRSFTFLTSEVTFLDLGTSERQYRKLTIINGVTKQLYNAPSERLIHELTSKTVTFVIDFTSLSASSPETESFSLLWKDVLWLMKLTLSGKIIVSHFIVVSSQSLPYQTSSSPNVASVVQGMLGVYRREAGLSCDTVWGMDVPEGISVPALSEILRSELSARQETGAKSSSVALYRLSYASSESTLARFVPILIPASSAATFSATLSGVSVIVGMGSIGTKLAPALLGAGSTTIVFLGRKTIDHPEVIGTLNRFIANGRAVVDYIQTDASDLSSLRRALHSVVSRHGAIKNIIYTAGVVRDGTIAAATEQDFEFVFAPKILGAWNIHCLSEEMSLELESFLMLSSVSVAFGNPGQAAYVGANAFLDALAAYRQGMGLKGLSLQLGAWESRLIEGLDLTKSMVTKMTHAEGIPLIMKAMTTEDPVQVIANIDIEKMLQHPTIAHDPMYHEFLASLDGKRHRSILTRAPLSKADAEIEVLKILQELLELESIDELDQHSSLISCGIDSIAFAQARGKILNKLSVDVPVMYLSETYSIRDMVTHICSHI